MSKGADNGVHLCGSLTPLERANLAACLQRHNAQQIGSGHGGAVHVALRDGFGGLAGGAIGFVSGAFLEVKVLWVSPQYRRSGWGGRLLQELEGQALAAGARKAFLFTVNPHARNFYRRNGYRSAGQIACDPAAQQAVWVFEKEITHHEDGEPADEQE